MPPWAASPDPGERPLLRVGSVLVASLAGALLLLAAWETALQIREDRLVSQTVRPLLAGAAPRGPVENITTLRDFIRRTVVQRLEPSQVDRRPFLRVTAAETLRSRTGYCGEVTRLFIVMAGEAGIPARRVTLYGPRSSHVVAEALVAPERWIVVDCLNTPVVPDLSPLADVLVRTEFDDYERLRLHRPPVLSYYTPPPRRPSWLEKLSREPPAFSAYWTERPHALLGLILSGVGASIALTCFLAARRRQHAASDRGPSATGIRTSV